MAADLAAPPVLSTPDDHILDAPAPASTATTSTLSDDALRTTYEVSRTVAEIQAGGWATVALQFPDHMLVDAPRVAEVLGRELGHDASAGDGSSTSTSKKRKRICVLADTSYSACCVDEVAAEHADADVVVHYGRTCLSPTSRLPVIYVYTRHKLDHEAVLDEFEREFVDKEARIVVMADLTYQDHVHDVVRRLRDERGYGNAVATEVVRDPGGLIPNRKIKGAVIDEGALKTQSLFHISDPPTALLLALHSRVASMHILSTPPSATSATTTTTTTSITNPTLHTAGLLRRRFARVLSLASAGVVGILVNTLSVADYLASADALRARVARAGKKSYTVVVGKLNPAKLANFAEVEGWVVVGCWESGLVEDDAAYWRPVVTPFELEVALTREEKRVWGGEWWAGIEKLRMVGEEEEEEEQTLDDGRTDRREGADDADAAYAEDGVDGDESLPPQFDLRTGKLVSHSRPMRLTVRSAQTPNFKSNSTPDEDDENTSRTPAAALIRRDAPGELASVNGVASPGAEFLRSKRTWMGLGSDFAAQEEEKGAGGGEASAVVEEGRSGIARGYTVGEEAEAETRR